MAAKYHYFYSMALLGLILASGVTPASAATADNLGANAPAISDAAAQLAVDLRFRDFYKMPVGPRGLEPTAKLLSLDGKLVRIRGYMAHQELPTPGMFVLSPLPVELGDEDESLADDLPPAVVFVHLDGGLVQAVPHVDGMIQLTGVLTLGSREEQDGHVSQVRLQLDSTQAQTLLKNPATNHQAHR